MSCRSRLPVSFLAVRRVAPRARGSLLAAVLLLAPGLGHAQITQILDATGDGTHGFDFGEDVTTDVFGNVFVEGSDSDNVFKIMPGGTITQIIDATGDGTHPLAGRRMGRAARTAPVRRQHRCRGRRLPGGGQSRRAGVLYHAFAARPGRSRLRSPTPG